MAKRTKMVESKIGHFGKKMGRSKICKNGPLGLFHFVRGFGPLTDTPKTGKREKKGEKVIFVLFWSIFGHF